MLTRWRWWISPALVLAGLSGCGDGAGPAPEAEESGAEAVVTVRVQPARVGEVADVVEGLGRCEALSDHLATLTPAVEGHVHQLLVKQGATVAQGEPIVELDRAVAQADLDEKTATLDSLKAALALLKSLPRPEERRANELAVEQARVAVERAQEVVDKLRPLEARHEVAEQQVFDAEKALEAAQLQQQAAEATLHAMMIGPRPEAVDEAEAKIKTAEGQVEFSRAHLEFHTIRAPIAGVLDSLTCHPGQTISVGAPVGEVVDTSQVYVVVWLPARSALALRPGQSARVGLEGPGGPGATGDQSELTGRVKFVGRVADSQTGNLPIRVLVENPDGQLTVGQAVRVAIAIDVRQGVLQVPIAAVYDLGEGPLVNVVREGKVVTLHPEVGPEREGWVAVSGIDLEAGEPVIVEGGYNLPEETPVKLAEEQALARSEDLR